MLRRLLTILLFSAMMPAAIAYGEEPDIGEVNPLVVGVDLAVVTAIVFLVLLLVLGKFAWKPIMEGLEKREKGISDHIEGAQQANEKAQAALAEYEKKLTAATAEVHAMLAEARREADANKDKILAEAKEAAQRERDRALADIAAAKNGALEEIAQKHVDHAFALARRVIQSEIKPADHARLVNESVDKFANRN